MSAPALLVEHSTGREATGSRLAVAWQHPVSRSMSPVGLLSCNDDRFTFDYLRSAREVEGFQPLIGFPAFGDHYESLSLFPLFAQRVMRRGRPDFARYVDYLALTDTDDWAILARTHGQREGDGVRVFAEPTVDAEHVSDSTFFVSGLRHRLLEDAAVGRALAALSKGEELDIVEQNDNPVDSRALLVAPRSGVAVGWIPNVLLPHVHAVRLAGAPALRVEAVHGADVPPGYRLLVRLRGQVASGYRAFGGPGWELADGRPGH